MEINKIHKNNKANYIKEKNITKNIGIKNIGIIVHKGLEEEALFELQTKGIKGTIVDKGFITFTPQDSETLRNIRTAKVIIGIIPSDQINGLEKSQESKKEEEKKIIKYKVEILENSENKKKEKIIEEVIKKIDKYLTSKYGESKEIRVDLKNPDIVFGVVNNYIGIIKKGLEREYKVFHYSYDIKPTLASNLVFNAIKATENRGKETCERVLVDPFAGTGTIGIEAAMINHECNNKYFKKIYLYDKRYKRLLERSVKIIDGFINDNPIRIRNLDEIREELERDKEKITIIITNIPRIKFQGTNVLEFIEEFQPRYAAVLLHSEKEESLPIKWNKRYIWSGKKRFILLYRSWDN